MSVAPGNYTLFLTTTDALAWRLQVRVTTHWRARLVGLLGTDQPPLPRHGLLLWPSASVHTVGMRYAIDIAYCDAHGNILKTRRHVAPQRLVAAPRRGVACLEMAGGALPLACQHLELPGRNDPVSEE